MPVNIGWCDGKEELYAQRSCLVRATQAESGNTATGTLTQTAGTVVTLGNSPYYQWGRKDPLQASNGSGNVNKTYYTENSAYAPQNGVAGKKTIGEAIRTPYIHYTYGGSSPTDWCSVTYFNTWSSTMNGTGTGQNGNARSKTIYDPSPVGFRVPALDDWNSLSTDNFITDTVNGNQGRTYTSGDKSIFFPAAGYRYNSSDALDNVGRQGLYWSSVPYNDNSGYYLSFSFNLNLIFVYPLHSGYRAGGFSVRPVQDN